MTLGLRAENREKFLMDLTCYTQWAHFRAHFEVSSMALLKLITPLRLVFEIDI